MNTLSNKIYRPTTTNLKIFNLDSHIPMSPPKIRGERLRTLRMMAGLTRNLFGSKYNLSTSTIQSWEDGRAGGLTRRGANLVVTLFRQEGLYCTPEWLLFGIGNPPRAAHSNYAVLREQSPTYHLASEETAIMKQLKVFKEYNKGTVNLLIKDDGMAPSYKPGDYVAGKIRKGSKIQELIGLDCIVQLSSRQILARRIRRLKPNGLYDLICINLSTQIDFPVLYDQEIRFAAPITWMRRTDPFSR